MLIAPTLRPITAQQNRRRRRGHEPNRPSLVGEEKEKGDKQTSGGGGGGEQREKLDEEGDYALQFVSGRKIRLAPPAPAPGQTSSDSRPTPLDR